MVLKEHELLLQQIYHELDLKRIELFIGLDHRVFELESGWYNGHYHRVEGDLWGMEYYPIAVISVKGYCDVEIGLDSIHVSTKRKRGEALSYSYEKVKQYPFEAFGVEEYRDDYRREGQSIEEMKQAIRACDEREIGFSFQLPWDTDGKAMYEFAKLLRREGFYY